MKATATLPVLDFTDVGRPLKKAGGNIRHFGVVDYCNYAGSLSGTMSYRLVIRADDQTNLTVCSHQLAFGWFGVRAALHMGRDEALCAAWMFSDARRSDLDDSPALCIRCLKDCDGQTCPYRAIEIQQIPLARLAPSVVQWARAQLPSRTAPSRR